MGSDPGRGEYVLGTLEGRNIRYSRRAAQGDGIGKRRPPSRDDISEFDAASGLQKEERILSRLTER